MNEIDQIFMSEAVRLARENALMGGGPFGAVIVRNNQVVATGVNRVTLHHDPTAHAEVQAIRAAGTELNDHELKGCTIYSSCEPCPMCLGAIYWSHIERVVFASSRHDAEKAGFRDAELYEQVALDPAERSIAFEQVRVADAGEEFVTWMKNPAKTEY